MNVNSNLWDFLIIAIANVPSSELQFFPDKFSLVSPDIKAEIWTATISYAESLTNPNCKENVSDSNFSKLACLKKKLYRIVRASEFF